MLLLLLSCRQQEPLLLSESQLVPILADIHIARSVVVNAPTEQRDSIHFALMEQVCLLHDITREQLDHDLQLLSADPDHMERIYNEVISLLEGYQAEAEE